MIRPTIDRRFLLWPPLSHDRTPESVINLVTCHEKDTEDVATGSFTIFWPNLSQYLLEAYFNNFSGWKIPKVSGILFSIFHAGRSLFPCSARALPSFYSAQRESTATGLNGCTELCPARAPSTRVLLQAHRAAETSRHKRASGRSFLCGAEMGTLAPSQVAVWNIDWSSVGEDSLLRD